MNTEKPRIVSNKVVIIAVASALVLLAAGLWYRSAPRTAQYSSSAQGASLRIEVLDGLTNDAISGAVIVIPETGKSYQTDSSGMTEPIDLPPVEAEAALAKPWAEASVLIYKDGYVPYALFHVNAVPGETREGPKVYLFPEASVKSAQAFSVTEGPPREWVNELVDKNRP